MKKHLTKFKTGLSALIITGALTAQSQGALLASESYTGYTVNSTIQGANGGTGWNSVWNTSQPSVGYLFTVRNPAIISYPGYTGATTPAASGGNYQNLASGFGGNQTTSVSRTLNTSGGGTFATNGLVSGGLIGADNTSLWGSFLYSSDNSGETGTRTQTFTLNGGGSFSIALSQPQASNLFVYKMDFGAGSTDTVTYWTNPNLATFDGTSGGTTTAPGNYSFNQFNMTTTYSGGAGSQFAFDDIRFGTTLADVAPVVPEPSTYALIGLSGLAVLVYRKKQRAFES